MFWSLLKSSRVHNNLQKHSLLHRFCGLAVNKITVKHYYIMYIYIPYVVIRIGVANDDIFIRNTCHLPDCHLSLTYRFVYIYVSITIRRDCRYMYNVHIIKLYIFIIRGGTSANGLKNAQGTENKPKTCGVIGIPKWL